MKVTVGEKRRMQVAADPHNTLCLQVWRTDRSQHVLRVWEALYTKHRMQGCINYLDSSTRWMTCEYKKVCQTFPTVWFQIVLVPTRQ